MIQQETCANGFIRTWSDDPAKSIKNIATGDIFKNAMDDPAWKCEYEECDMEECVTPESSQPK